MIISYFSLSFNNYFDSFNFLLFLSGYHNTAKQKFLAYIFKDNPSLKWKHFGDLDPDGFYIIEHLKENTGIDFKPEYMTIEYLKKYSLYCKTMTENDNKKAVSLIKSGKYVDIMEYMIKNQCKLEQEIISWLEKNIT